MVAWWKAVVALGGMASALVQHSPAVQSRASYASSRRRTGFTTTTPKTGQCRAAVVKPVGTLDGVAQTGEKTAALIQAAAVEARYPRSEYNGLILASLLGAALSALLFRDVLAIMALHEYDAVMEANWIPESLKLLARLPSDFLRDYGEAAERYPIPVKAATSGVSYLIGDFVAQVYEGRREVQVLDLSRSFRNAASGILLHGPILHFWIQFLEREFTWFFLGIIGLSSIPSQTPVEYGLIASKIVLDQTVFALGFNTVYTLGIGALAFKRPAELVNSLKTTLLPSIFASWKFWPIVHLLSYSPIIPENYKLLYIDVCEVFWVAILSYLASSERDADPSPPVANVLEEFDVQPGVEVVLARYVEIHGDLPDVVSGGPNDYDRGQSSSASSSGGSPDQENDTGKSVL